VSPATENPLGVRPFPKASRIISTSSGSSLWMYTSELTNRGRSSLLLYSCVIAKLIPLTRPC
jgi:hypothetical protein